RSSAVKTVAPCRIRKTRVLIAATVAGRPGGGTQYFPTAAAPRWVPRKDFSFGHVAPLRSANCLRWSYGAAGVGIDAGGGSACSGETSLPRRVATMRVDWRPLQR